MTSMMTICNVSVNNLDISRYHCYKHTICLINLFNYSNFSVGLGIAWGSVTTFSLSINIRSHVPVLFLVILNGTLKSYTISWLYQNLSSRVLNDSRDLAVTTVSGRLFHGSVIRIGNNFFLKFSLALCVNSFRECPLFPVLCDISLFLNRFGTDSWSQMLCIIL